MKKKKVTLLRKSFAIILTFFMFISGIISNVPIKANALDSRIEFALQWAVNIANDNSHGYSQANRWGPDYDCSSLIISALKQAGLDVGNSTYTGDMKSNLTKRGFTWIPWNQLGGAKNLRRVDILLNE